MRTMWTMCSVVMLIGCGQGADDTSGDPKSRSNDVGPIERELRRTSGSSDEPAPSAPAARRDRVDGRDGAEPRPARAPRGAGAGSADRVAAVERAARRETARETDGPEGTSPPRSEAVTSGSERPTAEIAAARPQPEPGERAPAEAAAEIVLSRVVVARAIENREPVGASPFAADLERVYLFIEAQNDGPDDARLAVEWIGPDGTRGQPIELRVPVAPRWRTWATTSRAHGRDGAWTVVVRHAGRELARETFEVRAGSDELASAPSGSISAGG